MAGTVLVPQVPIAAGIVPGAVAAAAQMELPNAGGQTVLRVINGSGASINVTITGQGKIDDIVVPDRVIAVPAGQTRMIGPLNPAMYNMVGGNVQLAFSATATVTVESYLIP